MATGTLVNVDATMSLEWIAFDICFVSESAIDEVAAVSVDADGVSASDGVTFVDVDTFVAVGPEFFFVSGNARTSEGQSGGIGNAGCMLAAVVKAGRVAWCVSTVAVEARASVEVVSMAGTVDDVVDLGAVSIDVTAAVRYLTGFRLADDTIAAVAFIAGTCPASDASDVVDNAGAGGVP